MKEILNSICITAKENIANASDEAQIEEIRVKYLGKKGELTAILKQMGSLSPEERPKMGQLVNEAKQELENLISQKKEELKALATEKKLKEETIDITMPAKEIKKGKLHPLNTVLDDMINIFQSMGFDVVDGPEVETDHYNFECLNVPADHPAKEKHAFLLSYNQWRNAILHYFGYDPLKCPNCGTNMIFLELYFKHKPVSLQELYEKAMRKHRCRSPALHSALPQLRYS